MTQSDGAAIWIDARIIVCHTELAQHSKRLRRKGETVALEPANKAYETRIFGPDRVKVQGRLIALMRRY